MLDPLLRESIVCHKSRRFDFHLLFCVATFYLSNTVVVSISTTTDTIRLTVLLLFTVYRVGRNAEYRRSNIAVFTYYL